MRNGKAKQKFLEKAVWEPQECGMQADRERNENQESSVLQLREIGMKNQEILMSDSREIGRCKSLVESVKWNSNGDLLIRQPEWECERQTD